MQPQTVAKPRKNAISKTTLSFLVVFYLLALNLIANKDPQGSLFYSVWPALLTLFLLSAISIFPSHLLKTISIALIGIASSTAFFKYKYNIVITDDIVLSTWLNDSSLSMEMLSFNLVLWLVLSAILPALYVALVPIKNTVFPTQLVRAFGACLLSAAGIYAIFLLQGMEFKNPGAIRDPKIANSISYFTPVDFLYSAREARKAYLTSQAQYSNITQLSKKYHYDISTDMQDLFVLVIVGETARGDRFSLNGYAKNTNPKLATLNNLHSFSNVSSCDTITIRSLKCIFTRVTGESRAQGITESAFTDVFKSLGFSIDIFSLQGMTDVYQYLGYDQLVSNYAVIRNSPIGAKDRALLPFLAEAVKHQQGRHLVILHTLGSHHAYNDRLEETNKRFNPSCTNPDVQSCSVAALNNAYDNTIVATDAFLHDAIRMLENRKSVVLYVSDHGESLGENGIYYHGSPPDIAPKEQFSVPMMIWLSPALIDTSFGRQMAANLAAQKKTDHFSHDNFFHSVLGCSGISSSNGGMDADLNLCGPKY